MLGDYFLFYFNLLVYNNMVYSISSSKYEYT